MKNSYLFIPLLAVSASVAQFNPFTNSASEDGKSFTEFVAQFEQLELPYTIGEENFQQKKSSSDDTLQEATVVKPVVLGYEFSKFLPVRKPVYSRLPPPQLVAVGLLAKNKTSTSLLIASKSRYNNTSEYILLTYKNNGELLEKKSIAGNNFKNMMTASIDVNLGIATITYEKTWNEVKKDYDISFKEQKFYQLQSNGVLEENNSALVRNTKQKE